MAKVVRASVPNDEVVQYYVDVICRYEDQQPDQQLIRDFSRPAYKWDEVLLTEQEFLSLETPAGWDNPDDPFKHLLLKDVTHEGVVGGDIRQSKLPRRDIAPKLEDLRAGRDIGHLIIRQPLPNGMPGSSFYIEDGFGKAVAIKKFMETGGTIEVKAFRASF